MKRIWLVAAVALAAASCRSYIRTDYFIINTDPAVEKAAARLPFTVAVNNVRAPSRYQDQINYRTSDYRVGFYEYSRWAETPSEMVRRSLINGLRSSGLFDKVDPSDIAWGPNLVLQCGILTFDQVVEKSGLSAECALALELMRSDTGKPVWAKEVRARVRQAKRGAFVAAMSEAVAQAIGEGISDMEKAAAEWEIGAGAKPGAAGSAP